MGPSMPGPGFELPAPGARAEWLAVQRAGYLSEPCSALERVASLQALLDQLLQGGQPLDDLGVALGTLLAEMYGELWRSEAVEQTLDALLPSVLEAGRGHLNDRIAVLALRSRMHLRFGRRAEGMALLAPISRLAEGSEDPLIRAHRARTLGHAQAALQDWALAITHLREAQALAAEAGDGGRWVDMLITIAVAHRQLGEPQAELAALREGAELAETQRRWAGALNGWTGVAEACLQRQDLAAAQQAFERGQHCLQQAGGSAERLLKEQLAVQARLHAARGEYEPAIALMQEVLSQTRRWSMSRQLQHRMRQLVPWLAQAGRADEALALLEEAHGLALEELREAGRRDTAERLRQAELAQARSEQARSETHARELALKNRALEQALALQRELQAELLEAGKLASLGHLLAGMAHELNTPLGTALTAVSTAADTSRALAQQLGERGPSSRSRVLAELRHCEDGAELARRNVEQALRLVQTYQATGQAPDQARSLQLDTLVRAAWERAISPGSPLQLDLEAHLQLHTLAEPLSEVLVQLFHNAERHAYPAGQAGRVRVRAWRVGARVHLQVCDQGAGIPPELLPRVFDPYVSSQFGRGRSGLGLFIAQAAVSQRLGGRLRVQSEPRRGCCFELDWPVTD